MESIKAEYGAEWKFVAYSGQQKHVDMNCLQVQNSRQIDSFYFCDIMVMDGPFNSVACIVVIYIECLL